MSSISFEPGPAGRAERKFRAAFDRLRQGKPDRLPKGTKVTQNNVAKEAGVDPSALRRSRFPVLVAEIQNWVELNRDTPSQQSPRQTLMARRARTRGLREQMAALKAQRDDALSKLVGAEAKIVALTIENERMRALLPESKVVPIRPTGKK